MRNASKIEVTTPASASNRRLVTAAEFNAAVGQGAAVDQAKIEAIIDGVSEDIANYCGCARDTTSGAEPTLVSETLRATFSKDYCATRTHRLLLPWRTPITSFTSFTEAGLPLALDTDYRHIGGGILERVSDGYPVCWSWDVLIVAYVAGLTPGSIPPGIKNQVIDQVKLKYFGAGRDPAIMSENIPDVYSATYGVAGGRSIGESGLLKSLEQALTRYKVLEV